MNFTIAAEAEQELVDGARFYAAQGNIKLGQAFISELRGNLKNQFRSHAIGSKIFSRRRV